MKQLVNQIKAHRHYDKLQHFVGGIGVVLAYYVLGMLSYFFVAKSGWMFGAMVFMMAPYIVYTFLAAVLVHGVKEVLDYLAMRRGENNKPSLYDFLAGVAGSAFAIWLFFF